MTRAIVYVPPTDYAQSAALCIEYIRAHGYEFRGLVQDWSTAQRMMRDDECTVTVVADLNDLDPDRKPRVEVVSDPPAAGKWWDETTRYLRRDERWTDP